MMPGAHGDALQIQQRRQIGGLRAFQQDNGLAVTGRLDAATMDVLAGQ